jgi:hypothetical protein
MHLQLTVVHCAMLCLQGEHLTLFVSLQHKCDKAEDAGSEYDNDTLVITSF